MKAGLLTEQIEIYSPTTIKNEYGEETTSYIWSYSTRARLIHDRGNRDIENNEVVFNHFKTFHVRIYVPVHNLDRIKWNDEFYRIVDIEPDRKLQEKIIKVELIND